MKKRVSESDWTTNATIFVLILALICLFFFVRHNRLISKCSRMIIGTVQKISIVENSSIKDITLSATYLGENVTIHGDISENQISKVGKRYFIKIACENPQISDVNWKTIVPDTLKNMPTNGWGKIPYGLDK